MTYVKCIPISDQLCWVVFKNVNLWWHFWPKFKAPYLDCNLRKGNISFKSDKSKTHFVHPRFPTSYGFYLQNTSKRGNKFEIKVTMSFPFRFPFFTHILFFLSLQNRDFSFAPFLSFWIFLLKSTHGCLCI